MDDTYLTTVNTCNVGWYVICSIPSEIIMKERSEMQKYIILFAGIASLVAIVAGAVFSIRMADPVATVVSSINGEIREDGFPDVLGRKFFKDREYTFDGSVRKQLSENDVVLEHSAYTAKHNRLTGKGFCRIESPVYSLKRNIEFDDNGAVTGLEIHSFERLG